MKKKIKKHLTWYYLHSKLATNKEMFRVTVYKQKGPVVCKDVQDLLDKGFTKWGISKALGVSWNAVHCWHRGFYAPEGKKREKFRKFYLNSMIRNTTNLTNSSKYVS